MNINTAQWPLFDEFPKLATLLAPVKLADLPTPVQAIPALGQNAWIKRDDITHRVYGGNKIRKLEFVLTEIRRKHSREVFTLGATGTNAGIAVSMICAQENIPCTIITIRQQHNGRDFGKMPGVIMNGDYFGAGYGESTAASKSAIAVFEQATGLLLESTYSGKTAAAFLDRLAAQDKPVLFWNTFNSRRFPDDAARFL